MKKTKKFKNIHKGEGLWIPMIIWENHRLTLIEKALLTKIQQLDKNEHCFATNAYFAEFCSCSESSITKAIKRLKKMNLIEDLGMRYGRRYIKCLIDYNNL